MGRKSEAILEHDNSSSQTFKELSRLVRPAILDAQVRELLVMGCGKLYRALSRLYRNEILQENMRLKALAEIYTTHSFAQLCNLNFLAKFCQHFW